jgi:hypothetical protein
LDKAGLEWPAVHSRRLGARSCRGRECGWEALGMSYLCFFPWLWYPLTLVHLLPVCFFPSMSHSFGDSYRVGSTKGVHALTVFCSWDCKVTQNWASRIQQDSIRTQLKVSSAPASPGHRMSPCCPAPQDPAWLLLGPDGSVVWREVFSCELALGHWVSAPLTAFPGHVPQMATSVVC